jgi:F-type H+-transporting ATPase subunit b
MLNGTLLALAAAEAEGGGFQDLLKVEPSMLLATVVVFVLFAFVLARFAWRPLLTVVDEREKAIREQVDFAERAAAEGRELLAKHQELLRSAGRERDEILAKAAKEAEAVHGELLAKARSEAEALVARAREQLRREEAQALEELRSQVAEIAVEAASRIVRSSLSGDAQRRLVDDYIRSLPGPRAGGRA